MSWWHHLIELAAPTRGAIHTIELGATIGILTALFWRSNREVAMTTVGISSLLIFWQKIDSGVAAAGQATYLIGRSPFRFFLPLALVLVSLIAIDYGIRRLIWMEASDDVQEALSDMSPDHTDRLDE